MTSSFLEVQNATIRFGGLTALNNVTFSVPKGSLMGLIGPNGAGKSTCFNLIAGIYQPTSGEIYFNKEPIGKFPSCKIAQIGIARTFQNIRLFKRLSVLDNVLVGHHLRHHSSLLESMIYTAKAVDETKHFYNSAFEWLKILELDDVAHMRSSDLSYGKQRKLEIARAMATGPELLLMDEPAAGMNPQESEQLSKIVRKLKEEFRTTILVIEHDMKFVMNLCENIIVLDHGEKLAEGDPHMIRNHPKVIEAYLGQAH